MFQNLVPEKEEKDLKKNEQDTGKGCSDTQKQCREDKRSTVQAASLFPLWYLSLSFLLLLLLYCRVDRQLSFPFVTV